MLQQIGLDSARGFCSVSLFRSFCSWHTPLVRLCLTLPVLVATYWRLGATTGQLLCEGQPCRGSHTGLVRVSGCCCGLPARCWSRRPDIPVRTSASDRRLRD